MIEPRLDIGELPSLSIYDGSAERRHADSGAADPHSRLMLQALELDNKLFEGQGAVRRMAAGRLPPAPDMIDPARYRPELPSSNRSHKGEDRSSDFIGD